MSSKEQTQPVDQEDDRLQKEMNLYHTVAKAIFSRLGKDDLALYLLVRRKIQQKQAKTQDKSEVVDNSPDLTST